MQQQQPQPQTPGQWMNPGRRIHQHPTPAGQRILMQMQQPMQQHQQRQQQQQWQQQSMQQPTRPVNVAVPTIRSKARLPVDQQQQQLQQQASAELQALTQDSLHTLLYVPNFSVSHYPPATSGEVNNTMSLTMSAHQVESRSPRRHKLPMEQEDPSEMYYQAVTSFLVAPQQVFPQTLYKLTFTLTSNQFDQSINIEKQLNGLYTTKQANGSNRWRVRSCRVQQGPTVQDHEWAVSKTEWPDHIHIGLYNSRYLRGSFHTVRRQSHYGKDLPLDITAFVAPGGNELHVTVDVRKPSSYCHAIAVEEVQTLNRQTILDYVQRHGMIPESLAHEHAKSRGRRGLDLPDLDGLSLSSDELTIDLADPFTKSIFKVPVRGKHCTHLECFDLDIWLQTRPPKTLIPAIACPHSELMRCDCEQTEKISRVDVWNCPICGRDASPYSLQIDGFLLKVRQSLEQEDKLNAKRLLLSPDGSWTTDGTTKGKDEDNDTDEDERTTKKRRIESNVQPKGSSAPCPSPMIILD